MEAQPLTILYLYYIKVHVRKYVSVSMTNNIKLTTVLSQVDRFVRFVITIFIIPVCTLFDVDE